MPNNKTNQFEFDVLDFFLDLSATAPTRPTALYFALFTADPGEAGSSANEVPTAGPTGYARQALTLDRSGNTVSNPSTVSFTSTTVGFGTVTHAAICKGPTRGTDDLLVYGPLSASRTVNAGETLQFIANAIQYSEE